MVSEVDEKLNEIISKLDKIIMLLSMNLVKEYKLQKDKIVELYKLGFKPKEIAEILGTTENTVNVTLSKSRKEGII